MLGIAGLIVGAIGLLVMLAAIRASTRTPEQRDVGRELAATKRQLAHAEKALRAIANGAVGPHLEAQIALDRLTELEG